MSGAVTEPYPPLPSAPRLSSSPLLKLGTIAILTLLLLIPLGMVRSLVNERHDRYNSVLSELGELWGRAQLVGGPVLTVPYRVWYVDDERRWSRRSEAYFLPDELQVRATLHPERRNRGLYEAVVYRVELAIEGALERPDFAALHVSPADVLWSEASLGIGITDPRGLRRAPILSWGGQELELKPGTSPLETHPGALVASGLEWPTETGERLPFELALELNGSGRLDFLPLARETVVEANAGWPNPSFDGAFLPVEREITADGFSARWQTSYFGTALPSSWRFEEEEELAVSRRASQSSFGLALLLPVDHYQKTERVVKYAVLFVGLTFVGFFLFEIFRALRLHPFQYLLVGCALCLFYLLVLSLTEHLSFSLAYLTAALATILLITTYASAVLAGIARGSLVGAILGLLYGYLYVILQAQDVSLLLGSVALFAVLAVVMYATRHIDWYALGPSAGVNRRAGAGGPEHDPARGPAAPA